MSWKLLETKTLRPSKQLTDEFMSMKPVDGDRFLRPNRMAILRGEVMHGLFTSCVWACVLIKEIGELRRVNGKHTSNLFGQIDASHLRDIFIYVQRYECDTLQDAARLYSTFDPRNSVRSTGDINRSFSQSQTDTADVPAKVINCCVTGISFSHWESMYTAHPAPERAQFIISEKPFILFANEAIGGSSKEGLHLLRGPVLAAMFRTWKKDRKAASEFWTLVKTGDGKSGSADRKLFRYLLTCSVRIGNGARTGGEQRKAAVTPREVYIKCIHAWNAWRNKESTDLKWFSDKPTPAVK